MTFNRENHVKNLPDLYEKSKQGNLYKILEIERLSVEELRSNAADVFEILDIDKAYGKNLDFLYGERVGQPRGKATDGQYLYIIKAKIMRNLVNSSYDSIVNGICATFNCVPSQVYMLPSDTLPCVVTLITMPLAVINAAGLTTRQATSLIRTFLPVGVRLESMLFEGTFEFSDEEMEQNRDAGFTDKEDGFFGGYFGMVLGEDDIDLPI